MINIEEALNSPEAKRFDELFKQLEPDVAIALQAALMIAAMRRAKRIMVALRGFTELPDPSVTKLVNKPYYRRSRW